MKKEVENWAGYINEGWSNEMKMHLFALVDYDLVIKWIIKKVAKINWW